MALKIGIIGSINIDFVTVAKHAPKAGESVMGDSFTTVFGGKGANLAVAASRLGGNVALIGAVGDDALGINALNNLAANNVDVSAVQRLMGQATGTASITVTTGNNQIIVVPGANAGVTDAYVSTFEGKLRECAMLSTQLEIDPSAVLWLSRFAKQNDIKFIFNPSPMIEYNSEIFENADLVIVNEIEIAKIQADSKISSVKALLYKYPNKLILTMGAGGVKYCDGIKVIHVPAVDVKVIDTTGAGDTFMGALMVRLCEGATLEQSIKFANTAAALKCTKLGAQTGMPLRNEVDSHKV